MTFFVVLGVAIVLFLISIITVCWNLMDVGSKWKPVAAYLFSNKPESPTTEGSEYVVLSDVSTAILSF